MVDLPTFRKYARKLPFRKPAVRGMSIEENARFWERVRRFLYPVCLVSLAGMLAWNAGHYCYNKYHEPKPPEPKKLERRLRLEGLAIDSPRKEERVKYTVLINGSLNDENDKFERQVMDISVSKTYETLLSAGFQPKHMYILERKGEKNTEFSYPVDDVASRESICMTFKHLKGKVDDNDLLFVYVGDHGNSIPLEKKDPKTGARWQIPLSYMCLHKQAMLQTTFYDCLDGIRPKEGVLFFSQCGSGGFVDELEKRAKKKKHLRRFLAIATTDAYGDVKGGGEESFEYLFMDAHSRLREADRDEDGVVSVAEAFSYTTKKHWSTRKGHSEPRIAGWLDPLKVHLAQ